MDSMSNLRQGLHQMIEAIKDVTILQAVYVILDREKKREDGIEDFYETLPDALKESIEKGLAQVANNEVISHQKIKERYNKWMK